MPEPEAPEYPCRAYVINPFVLMVDDGQLKISQESPIREVSHSGQISDIYRELSTPDRGVTTFEACYIDADAYGDCMYVDEEGLLHPASHFIRVDGFPNPVAGKGYVLGTDINGYSISPKASLAALWPRVSLAVGNVEVRLRDTPVGAPVAFSAVQVHRNQTVRIWAEEM